MKRSFLLLSMVALFALHVRSTIVDGVRQKPQPATMGFVVNEEVYLYNVGAQAFYTKGNAWGTQASIGDEAILVKFTQANNGAYLLNDKVNATTWYLAFFDSDTQMYVDRSREQPDYFWEVEDNSEGTFRLLASSYNPTFNKDYNPGMYVGLDVSENAANTALSPFLFPSANHYIDWVMVSIEEYEALIPKVAIYNRAQALKEAIDKVKAQGGNSQNAEDVYLNEDATMAQLDAAFEQLILDNATPQNPYDMTSRIANPSYDSNNDAGWSARDVHPAFQSYTNAEYYNTNYDTHQTIQNMPPGVYLLDVQAYYRAGFANDSYNNFTPNAILYAQTGETLYKKGLMNIFEGATDAPIGIGVEASAGGLYVPNDMQSAAAYFNAGRYHNEMLIGIEQTSDLTIGLYKDYGISGDWTCWDNWKLTYYGNGDAALRKWGEKVLEEYPETYGEGLASSSVTALYQDAREAILSATTFDEIRTGVAALPEVCSIIDANIAAWKTLKDKYDKMVALADNEDFAEEKRETLKSLLVEVQTAIDALQLSTEEINALTQRLDETATAVMMSPVKDGADMTILLTNPDFEYGLSGAIDPKGYSGSYGVAEGWVVDKNYNGNVTPGPLGTDLDEKMVEAIGRTNHCFEAWHCHNFDIYQEVKGAPVGVYEIEVQGFMRCEAPGYTRGDLAGLPNMPIYLYLNKATSQFPDVYSETRDDWEYVTVENWTVENINGYDYPNSMGGAAQCFAHGMYKKKAYGLIATPEDVLRIGVKGQTDKDAWVIWDNFKLTYRGFKADVVKPVLEEALAEITEYELMLMGKTESDAIKNALSDAATAIEENDGEAMFQALINLWEAKDGARISKDIFSEQEVANDTLRLGEAIREMEKGKLSKQTLDNAKALLESICKNERYENDEIDQLKEDVSNMISSLNVSRELYNSFGSAIDELSTLISGITEVTETVTEATALLETCQTEFEAGSVADADVAGRITAINNAKTPLKRILLTIAVAKAEMITDFGKTTESYLYLQNVIENIKGKNVENLGEYDINYYSNQLQNAINNIQLRSGYTYLTADMFKNWESPDAPASTDCAYEVRSATQMVYGNPNVSINTYADLSNYEKLYVPVVEGTPRVLMNRSEADGQFNEDQEQSKMIEMPKDGTWTDAYYTKSEDGKLFTYDLAKIVEENGFAHLNAIKGANSEDVTVSELIAFNSKMLIAEIDYSTKESYPYYRMEPEEGASYDVVNGALRFDNTSENLNPWNLQAFIIQGFSIKRGYDYVVRVTYKSTASGKINVQMGTWGLNMTEDNIDINATDSYTTLDIPFSAVTCPTDNNDAFVIWHGGNIVGTVEISKVEVYQIISDDPLFEAKVDLRDAVAKAELKTDFGKTEASFANLTTAISDAKTVLETAEDKTAITNALRTLNAAVNNLTLLPGYSYLTTEMFRRWRASDKPVSSSDYYYTVDCNYFLCESTGNVYGNSDVNEYDFADLSKYDYLYIPVVEGTPRVLMNRTETDGQFDADREKSKMIEIPQEGTWTDAYYTKSEDGKLFTYDIAKIVEENGFAHLNAIKDVNWGKVTVTDLILFTDPAVAEDEWNIMAAAYEQMEGTDSWTNKWNFSDESRLASNLPGVTIEHRHVVSVNLSGNKLSGEFPFALLNLPYMETLDVSYNSLSGDIGVGMTTWQQQSTTTESKLKEVRIDNNQLEGNLATFANAFPMLKTLYANNNQLSDIYPQIATTVNTLYYRSQQIGREIPLYLGKEMSEEEKTQLPTILFYDHFNQTYRDDLNLSVTDGDGFSLYLYYNNGKVTLGDEYKTLIYRKENGDILLAEAPNYLTFNTKLVFDEGDCNFDGEINVQDVQSDINYIFEEQSGPFNFTAANLWTDEIINVQDVVKEVTLLLEQEDDDNESGSDSNAPARSAKVDSAEPADAVVYCHNGQLVINTNKSVAAFDVTLRGSASINVSRTLRQLGFTCATKLTDSGIRLVAYSMSGAMLPVGETVIGTVSKAACVSRAMLTDKNASRVSVNINQTVTGIATPTFSRESDEVYRLSIGRNRAIVIDRNGNKTIQKNNSTTK